MRSARDPHSIFSSLGQTVDLPQVEIGDIQSVRRSRVIFIVLVVLMSLIVQSEAVATEGFPGSGKRVIYSKSEHRVWLINADETLSGTWKVTGNPSRPAAGSYSVYSRSTITRTLDGMYTFGHMVRFARTAAGIGIGFHDIPYNTYTKVPIMPVSKIGDSRYVSGGCVRQSLENAKRMWNWATIGTPVIVLQ